MEEKAANKLDKLLGKTLYVCFSVVGQKK